MLTLITGGAGFIGCNLAHRLLSAGRRVRILDDLSRPGVERNLAWLRERHGSRLDVRRQDVRADDAVLSAMRGCESVFHLAAQTAVTTSLQDPWEDFQINALGTLSVLEAARAVGVRSLVFTSTNKVYGNLGDLPLSRVGDRWLPGVGGRGIRETRPLDFHSPYGCSKGAADQYVLDYARCFGVPATVFRMSCIYGPRQQGTEDQGWVAHFARAALAGQSLTFYGDGCQVRDALYVDDLVAAFLAAEGAIERCAGRPFNLGGGADRTVSLRELVRLLEALTGRALAVSGGPERPGDQRWYVSDTRAFEAETGWRPRTSVPDGVARLLEWLRREVGAAPANA